MFTTPREAGILLRCLREDAGMTGAQLAEKARVSLRWLVSLENGKSSVDMLRVQDCFQALGYGFDLVPLPESWND
ncbi:MAG: helix-turn-helix domain-containing protein [Micrococcales bacterium]|nr:helix-turn-helix domain-containing protein [Micrococcales bacterium]